MGLYPGGFADIIHSIIEGLGQHELQKHKWCFCWKLNKKLFKNHWIFTNDHFPCITKQASAFLTQWIPLGFLMGINIIQCGFIYLWLSTLYFFIICICIGSLHMFTSSTVLENMMREEKQEKIQLFLTVSK